MYHTTRETKRLARSIKSRTRFSSPSLSLSLLLICSVLTFSSALFPSFARANTDSIRSWANGNITYNPETKTAIIKGEVTDQEIVDSRLNNDGAWSAEVEHIYLEPETTITCVRTQEDFDTDYAWLFGGYFAHSEDFDNPNDTECPQLKTFISQGTVHVKNKDASLDKYVGLRGAFYTDLSLEVISVNNWDIAEGVDTQFSLDSIGENIKKDIDLINSVPAISCMSGNISSKAIWMYASAQLSYENVVNYDYTNEEKFFSSLSIYWFQNGETHSQTVSSEEEYKAFAATLSDDDTVYYFLPTYVEDIVSDLLEKLYPSVAFVADNDEEVKRATYTTSGDLQTALKLPDTSDNASIIGWATSPDATEPEIKVDQTENLPVYGLCPLVWYAVYGDAPVPTDTTTLTFRTDEGSWNGIVETTLTGTPDAAIIAPVYPDVDSSRTCIGWFDETGKEIVSGVTKFQEVTGVVTARFVDTPGWHQNNTGWWYVYDLNNNYYTNCWALINSAWFYFNDAGYCLEYTWGYINGEWYFFGWGGYMQTGWQWLGGSWYFLDRINGNMHTGWVHDGVWYYCDAELGGAMYDNCWAYINGNWYGFNEGGSMTQGWSWSYSYDGWFYLDPETGHMLYGWQYIGGHWYYFYDNGLMVANTYVGNYWLGADGAMW